jgi:hypothetical protein
MILIFDLDGTTIDSSHRQLYDPLTGLLDLTHWLENNQPEKIMRDRLLPLAKFWKQRRKDTDDIIVVCTARQFSSWDYYLLENMGLDFDVLLSRPVGDRTPDDLLKVFQLHGFLGLEEMKSIPCIMFDDSMMVRENIRRLGFPVLNPEKIQQRIGGAI